MEWGDRKWGKEKGNRGGVGVGEAFGRKKTNTSSEIQTKVSRS